MRLIGFILINSICVISTLSHEIPSYHGDNSIKEYLQTFCTNATTLNSLLVLISLSTAKKEYKIKFPQKQMLRFLEQNKCSFIYYHNFESTKLTLLTAQWRYKKLLFLFDFTTSADLITKENFVSVLTLLDNFYDLCSNCLPLLGLFDLRVHQLTRWSEGILPALKRDFRIVLLSHSKTNFSVKSTAVHLNPVLHGCKLERQVFVPQRSEHFEQLKMPAKQCNLKSSTINASYNNILPFCDIAQKNGKTVIKFAIETEILKILQKRFNFQVNLIDGKGAWGMFLKGQWTGVVGRVYNKTSELALCAISHSLERHKVVSFSYPVYVDDLTFMSRSPNLRARDWLVFSPFSAEVWLCIVASLTSIAAVLYLTLKQKWKHILKPPSGISITIHLFALYFGQNTTLKWGQVLQVRILITVWVLAVLIFANSYSGCFYSILAIPEFELPIDQIADIQKLCQSDSGYMITIAESSYLQMFLTAAKGSIFNVIGQHMNRTQQQMVALDEEAVRAVEQRPRTTMIASRLCLATIRYVYARAPLHLAHDSIMSMDLLSFIFPLKSPLLEPFSMIIKRIYQTGLVEKLLSSTFARLPWKSAGASVYYNPTSAISGRSAVAVLAPADLRSVFFLWSFGVATALGCFLYEALLHLLITRAHIKSTDNSWKHP